MAVADASVRKADAPTTETSAVDGVVVDAAMREFFQKRPTEGNVEVAAKEAAQPGAPRRDFDMAAELLDRASKAFDLLISRCQNLEHELAVAHERAHGRAAEQEQTIEQWKRLAAGFKTQAEASEEAAAALKARCDGAEARAAMAEHRAAALERTSAQAVGHAATAEQLSTKLHDKVVAAFGIGSRAHPVLEVVATRVAAE